MGKGAKVKANCAGAQGETGLTSHSSQKCVSTLVTRFSKSSTWSESWLNSALLGKVSTCCRSDRMSDLISRHSSRTD